MRCTKSFQLGEIDVHARCLPEQKVEVIQQLKAIGRTGMVGDGINDAPALAAADVGIAMGVAGTAIAMETADIALMTNDLRKLSIAVELARQARAKIQQNIVLSITTKIIVLVLSLVGYAYLWVAVIADVGTCLVVIFNSIFLLEMKRDGSLIGHKHHTNNCCSKNTNTSAHNEEGMACMNGERSHTIANEIDLEANYCFEKSCCESTQCGVRRRVGSREVVSCDKNCHEVAGGPPFEHDSCCRKTGESEKCTKIQPKCCQKKATKKQCSSKKHKNHSNHDHNHEKNCHQLKGTANTSFTHTASAECCDTTSLKDQTHYKHADFLIHDSSESALAFHDHDGCISNGKDESSGKTCCRSSIHESVDRHDHKENFNPSMTNWDSNAHNVSTTCGFISSGDEASSLGLINLQASCVRNNELSERSLHGRCRGSDDVEKRYGCSYIQMGEANGCGSHGNAGPVQANQLKDCCPPTISAQHTKGCENGGCCDH